MSSKGASFQLYQEMLAAEKDVEDAAARLEDLLSRHQKPKAQLDHTYSPKISDLPVEILSMVFYSWFSEKDWGPKMENQHMLVPLDVEPVCHTWRQVAWSHGQGPYSGRISFLKRNGHRGMHVLDELATGSSVLWGGMVMNMDGRDQHLQRGMISRSATMELGQSWTNQGEEQVAWKRWEVFPYIFRSRKPWI
ncbi:hypothetical protein CPC08DRAFT_726852 [Agrocybe pediades]|nr:hypothetical protein CPC08DRAFT_726852 [Agrocybe pediades]